MKLRIYQVDAFTDKLFSGNPAAVCPLDKWLSDSVMQNIAMENNLAETAFYVKKEDCFQIRWFTPEVEVELCGHATLASAFVLFNIEKYSEKIICFYSPKSGRLTVEIKDDLLALNFPADIFNRVEPESKLTEAFNILPQEIYKGKTDYMFVFENEDEIIKIIPRFEKLNSIEARGIIVTAKGKSTDFVSRFFAPQSGVNEDPVTGSSHTTLIPYWAKKLGKNELTAAQLSSRGGLLYCRYLDERVEISGKARLYLSGEIYVDD